MDRPRDHRSNRPWGRVRSDFPTGSDRPGDYGRRDFLRAGAALGLTLGLPGCDNDRNNYRNNYRNNGNAAEVAEAQVRKRVTLGNTQVELPDIAFGSFALDGDTRLVQFALDHGITHFDTAESYTEGRSEQTLGRALEGHRDKVTLTSKTVAEADAKHPQLMKRLEQSLGRLKTDRIDFYLNHATDSLERVRNPEWAEFTSRAKAQGKIRFSGMSGHGPSLVLCLDEALGSGWLDVMLVAYNYIQSPDFLDSAKIWLQQQTGDLDWVALQPELPRMLARAKRQGVGVMTMKTLRGARHNDLRAYETHATFSQAALRWVLSDPRVDAAVVTMTSEPMINEYLGASGFSGPRREDLALLSRYERLNRETQCIQGCGVCLSACPSEVAVSDVLRIGMYDRDYGLTDVAKREYGALERTAAACASCVGTPCLSACPTGVAIAALARNTHRRLG